MLVHYHNVIYLSNSTIYASGSLTEEIIIQNLSDTTTTFIMETVSYDHILVENAYWDTTFSKVAASLLTGGSVVIPHNGQEGWGWPDAPPHPPDLYGYGMYLISDGSGVGGARFYIDLRSTDYRKGISTFDISFVYDSFPRTFKCSTGLNCIDNIIQNGDTLRIWEEKDEVNENMGAFEPTNAQVVKVEWSGNNPLITWWPSEPIEVVKFEVFRKLCSQQGCGGTWIKINTVVADTFYIDTDVTSGGRIYAYYKVRSLSGDGTRTTAFMEAAGNPLKGWVALKPVGSKSRNSKIAGNLNLYNSPNPFNPLTTIYFTTDRSGFVRLDLYDLRGRKVTTILDAYLRTGTHKLEFDGSNLSSGIYFSLLKTKHGIVKSKMLLLK